MALCGAWPCCALQASGKAAGKDRRNLYLAKEGEIKPGTPAWNGMSEHDRCAPGAGEARLHWCAPVVSPCTRAAGLMCGLWPGMSS